MLVTLLLLIAAYVALYKTRFGPAPPGLRRASQAADSVGINVYKMRWAGVLISGMLGGHKASCSSPPACPVAV